MPFQYMAKLLSSVNLLLTAQITSPGSRLTNLNNLDVQEPIVRRSPATDADFFGWTTVLHQIQTVGDADDLDTATGKTR